MFSSEGGLQAGSEYHESLVSFLKKENDSGIISLKRYHHITFIKWAILSVSMIGAISFVICFYMFAKNGSFLPLVGTFGAGFIFIMTIAIFSIFPFGLQSKFEAIDARFDDDSLLRLYRHGAPDDVIDHIISALGRTGNLSYSELYDIFWLCSRTSAGIDGKNLLGERYQQVKQRVRSRNFTQGQA